MHFPCLCMLDPIPKSCLMFSSAHSHAMFVKKGSSNSYHLLFLSAICYGTRETGWSAGWAGWTAGLAGPTSWPAGLAASQLAQPRQWASQSSWLAQPKGL